MNITAHIRRRTALLIGVAAIGGFGVIPAAANAFPPGGTVQQQAQCYSCGIDWRPDLIISDHGGTADHQAVYFTVYNDGFAASWPSHAQVAIDGVPQQDYGVPSLDPGQSATFTYAGTLANARATADSGNENDMPADSRRSVLIGYTLG